MPRIVVAVGGSIAAFKACDLVSKLVQGGHEVDCMLTQAAQRFVQPLSFSALSHRRTFTDEGWGEGEVPHDHLLVTHRADLLVVAPATANLIARFAHGLADDVVTAAFLAAACPRLVAPAMNLRMWESPRTQANVATLEGDGVVFVGPEKGYLAEAEVGMGRLAEVPTLLAAIDDALA